MTFTSFSTSFNSRGGRLYAKLLLPENGNPLPLAILCHGAGSDHRAVESSAECIAKRGVATFLFDFRGHGLSSGIYDGNTADDVVAAFEHLANYPEIDLNHVALVGHSMGASAALLAAAKLDKLSALVLLSCPPDEFEAPPEEILNKNGNFVVEYPSQCSVPWTGSFLGFIYRPWMKLRGQRMRINWQRFFEVYKSGDLSTALAKVKSCPILFVHCRGDRYAPYQSAVQLYEQARQPKEIILEPGGFHSAPTRSGKLRGKWVNWLVSVLTGNTEVKGE